MTEARPDTDDRAEPGGTPSPGPADLTDRPAAAGTDGTGRPVAVPGAYDAEGSDREGGKEVKPGN